MTGKYNSEHFPGDEPDEQLLAIGRLIETMGGETCLVDSAPAYALESRPAPPAPVNFRTIALHALSQGLFAPHNDAIQANSTSTRPGYGLPESLLDRPYENGPMSITRFGEDVPEDVMEAVRKNLARANRILLPSDRLLAYFHERCTQPDVFESEGMIAAKNSYNPQLSPADLNTDETLSFSLEGRATRQRKLFTATEARAGNILATERPELVMSIVGYAGLIQDYLAELGNSFIELSEIPRHNISNEDLNDYYRFISEWNTSNFTELLMPALAIFLEHARRDQPDVDQDQHITPALFQQAIAFLIDNGAFRNYFTVPADVAENGEKRINRFLCPAISAVRGQLLSGMVLHQLYHVANARLQANERSAIKLRDTILSTAKWELDAKKRHEAFLREQAAERAQTIIPIGTEGKDMPTILNEAVGWALFKGKPTVFSYGGKEHTLSPKQIEATLGARGQPPLEDSIPLELESLKGGATLGSVMGAAVGEALRRNRSVHFSFNFVDHRVDPEKVRALLELE